MNFFRKKKKQEEKTVKEIDWSSAAIEMSADDAHALFSGIFAEPMTNATVRLEEGAADFGAKRGFRAFNKHKGKLKAWNKCATAVVERRFQTENQWVNAPQSVNAGFSNAQLSYYLFQVVNYYDCMIQAQDPLMSKVLSILSETPFSKGGYIENLDKEQAKTILDEAERRGIFRKLVKAIRSMECVGGCLIYLQTEDEDLSEPLDLKTYDVRKIKDFIHIDPINVAATVVNTIEPAKADYMDPEIWYVIGLGNVHKSRFLKFEDNVPELLLRPMCMYFGTPLTNLIKQDIANSNLATQGLANIVNRCRYMFLKTDDQSYTTGNVKNFKARLSVMSKMQDNFMFSPIKSTEDVVQQTTALTGFAETTEFLYEVISAKTSIPMTELMGTSAKGLNATGEGDRRAWYDRVTVLRASVQNQLEVLLGIVAGKDDGQFKEIHYRFNALETPTERETAEIRKATLEVAKAIIEIGGSQEQTFDWLKKLDFMGLDNVNFDAESFEGDSDPFTQEDEPTGVPEAFSQNAGDFEGKHKRDKDGKFTSGGKGGDASERETSESDSDIPEEWGKSFSEYSGKPEKAIEKLISEKSGYVPRAIHKEGIGDIDFVYGKGGETGYGLAHIAEKHGEEILKEIPSLIENGTVDNTQKNLGRSFIYSEDKKIVISFTLFNKKRTWLLTAYTLDK